ncbi:MAG: hypothetical protein LBB94_05640, partial [Clostridiales bacterium]|nr:hypothetical protein [Clostridiales bacterium]
MDGYDIPGGWEKLMTRYYDVMYREEYGWWSLAMAFNASRQQFDDLAKYEFDGEEEGTGVEISFIEQNRIIITIHCSIEDYYDNDGGEDDDDSENGLFKTNNGLLNALTHIRRQIAAGDYRAL